MDRVTERAMDREGRKPGPVPETRDSEYLRMGGVLIL